MDRESNPDFKADESNHESSGFGQIPQGNYAEPVKNAPGNSLIRCDVCCCEMSSTIVLKSHINGSRHKKKVKALEIVANLRALGQKGVDVGSDINTNCYRCDLCCLTVNSPQQLQVHLSGSKHKHKIAKEKSLKFASMTNMKAVPAYEVPLRDAQAPPLKKKKKDEQAFTCDVCKIGLNSETQYEQHVYSKKHLSRSRCENVVNKPTALENEVNFPQSFTPGNQRHESTEFNGGSFQDESSVNKWRSGDASNIIQVHSPDNLINRNFSQNQSKCGNSDVFNNYKPIPRNFVNNRQIGGQCLDVGLYEVGKFFNKAKSSIYNSGESVVKASARP